jgi:hypothetical protein
VTGDEIHLIEPDGTGDRLVWRTGVAGVETTADVSQLAWRPDASELAFASRHEEACSFYNADIYVVRADGSGYRRVTSPPACGQRGGLPTGTVNVTIENWTNVSGPFVVYFEGAPAPQSTVVAPGNTATLTFANVADYGNFSQWAVVIFGEDRFTSVSGNANVQPGAVVNTGTIPMWGSSTRWGFRSPTWRSDGARLGFVFGSGTFYSTDPANSAPGNVGTYMLGGTAGQPAGMPLGPDMLIYAPVASRLNQALYTGWVFGAGTAILLVSEGSSTPGDVVVQVDQGDGTTVLGMAWLPDGSGFLYSATEQFGALSNIFEYRFATQQVTRVTNNASGYTRGLSVSPDGQQIVFEFQANGDWMDLNPAIDLRIIRGDPANPDLLVTNGRAPEWSPQAVPQPPVLDKHVYLPALARR